MAGGVWMTSYFSRAEKEYLDMWWEDRLAKAKQRPGWPPTWKPSRPKKRWKKK